MDGKVEVAIAPGAIVSSGFANGVPVISNNVGAVSGSGIVR